MASSAEGAPPVLTHYVERVGALHQSVVLLTITVPHVPFVPEAERFAVQTLGAGFVRIVAQYGFMESPNVTDVLARAAKDARLPVDPGAVTYFLGRETFLATSRGRLGAITESIFAFLSRNASTATAYFGIPPQQVVEIGTQIDL